MTAASATRTTRPALPLSGWALDLLVLLDAAHPGILRFAHQASPLRRQAIFLALAHLHRAAPEDLVARLAPHTEFCASDDPLQAISIALTTMRVRDIVRALHPGVQGLVGALGRLRPDPMHPLKYRALVGFLADADQRRAKVLRQIRISETALTVLRIVDPALLFPDLMRQLRTSKDAEGFVAAVDLIRRIVPGVTNAALVASLRALPPKSRLDAWAQRWVAKAKFPLTPPIQDDAQWRVLRSGKAMGDAAGRFQNCLRDKVGEVALGRTVYIEWVASDPRAMIEIAVLAGPGGTSQFVLEHVYGHRNGSVDSSVIPAICRKLQGAGILLPAKFGHARPYDRAAPLLNVWDFGFRGLPEEDIGAIDAYLDEVMREEAA